MTQMTTKTPVRIAFDDAGNGDTALLCLPGWCGGRAMFGKLAPLLAKNHRVLTLDWRGHGESEPPSGDFTAEDNVADAIAVLEQAGVRRVIPVAGSHAGWTALELLRRLGAARVPRIVSLDWIVLDPPPPFLGALGALQDPNAWQDVREKLFEMWLGPSGHCDVERYLREDMATYGAEMWGRAGREISAAYRRWVNPLNAFAELKADARMLHLYAQPRDEGYLEGQRAFARSCPAFEVRRIDAATHFPSLETPAVVAQAITDFVG